MLGAGPETDVHGTSISGQPQRWMSNPASILQPPHKGEREEEGHSGHGSQAGFPRIVATRYQLSRLLPNEPSNAS